MVQLTLDAMVNKNLFSNHYLESLIQKSSEWKKKDHEEVLQKIKRIYNAELAFVDDLNEAQLEEGFFQKIFRILLSDYEVQASTETEEFPDYAFFPDKQTLDNAHKSKGTRSFYTDAFAIGEVKRWDVELDRFGRDKHNKSRNPSFQTWLYIHETEPKWGMLSNGRKWRLYLQDRPLDCYYEIDLVTLLENNDVEGFRYFYYFFRKEAFLPSENGEAFLEIVLRESLDYAREIGENLKENVYRAMKKIADGFFRWPQNGLDPMDDRTQLKVQKSTMKLLYRFLFLLYAEGKGLLSLKEERYRDVYSFNRLKKEIKDKKDGPSQQYYSLAATTLWSRLQDLFRLIDGGSDAFEIPKDQFYIPAYNGGLFDPKRNPNLEKWTIDDVHLADAIDLLARSEANGSRKGFVDYSTLEIRHLGSIYEGLLEYKLKIAERDMVAKGREKKKEWVTLEEFNKEKAKKKSFTDFDEFDRVRAGEIYLATDKGERKATGSYYTPDYIVNYIVKNTLGPVVEERWKEALKRGESLVNATLSVKVLDPAMGSGHFLVGAVEFLAGKLLEAAQRDIEAGFVEDNEQFTSGWAKREIVSHCIYGVDLNDLAVELAKVSLWLTTISKDKPLSFLDHRLKQGNSLIGANLEDLPWHPLKKSDKTARMRRKGPMQLNLPWHPLKKSDKTQRRLDIPEGFIKKLVDTVSSIESLNDDSLANIKKKEEIFEKFRTTREYDMIKTLADVRTSIYFGNEIDKVTYGNYTGDAFWSSESEWKERRERWLARKGREIAEEKTFFHWELEFPEIFFEGGKIKENPGFDVVIGNPPYLQKESFDKMEKKFILECYPENTSNVNLATIFMSKSRRLTRKEAFHSFIVPKSLLFTKAWENDRERLLPNMHCLCDVSKAWKEVLLEQTIYVWQNSFKPITKLRLDTCENKSIRPGNLIKKNICSRLGAVPIELTSQTEKILNKCLRNGEGLSKHAELSCGLPYQIKLKERGDVPAIGGNEIWRYVQLDIKGYFDVKELENDKEFIKKINVPHIVLQRIVAHILSPKDHIKVAGTVDTTNNIPVNTITCLFTKKDSKLSLYFLCAWLNSRFYSWYAYNFIFSKAIRSMDLYEYFAVKVPLPKIVFNTDTSTRRELFNTFTELYIEGEPNKSYNNALSFVSDQIRNHTDVVHDLLG